MRVAAVEFSGPRVSKAIMALRCAYIFLCMLRPCSSAAESAVCNAEAIVSRHFLDRHFLDRQNLAVYRFLPGPTDPGPSVPGSSSTGCTLPISVVQEVLIQELSQT